MVSCRGDHNSNNGANYLCWLRGRSVRVLLSLRRGSFDCISIGNPEVNNRLSSAIRSIDLLDHIGPMIEHDTISNV